MTTKIAGGFLRGALDAAKNFGQTARNRMTDIGVGLKGLQHPEQFGPFAPGVLDNRRTNALQMLGRGVGGLAPAAGLAAGGLGLGYMMSGGSEQPQQVLPYGYPR